MDRAWSIDVDCQLRTERDIDMIQLCIACIPTKLRKVFLLTFQLNFWVILNFLSRSIYWMGYRGSTFEKIQILQSRCTKPAAPSTNSVVGGVQADMPSTARQSTAIWCSMFIIIILPLLHMYNYTGVCVTRNDAKNQYLLPYICM